MVVVVVTGTGLCGWNTRRMARIASLRSTKYSFSRSTSFHGAQIGGFGSGL